MRRPEKDFATEADRLEAERLEAEVLDRRRADRDRSRQIRNVRNKIIAEAWDVICWRRRGR